jgi:hypothetical protein
MTIALFARFPRLGAPSDSEPVIPSAARTAYPALAADFKALDGEVALAFAQHDRIALREQNRHRGQQVLILLGSFTVSGIGGIQAAFPDLRWPGIVVAVLSLAVGLLGLWAKRQRTLGRYLTARVKAERLRSLHFRYLSRTGRFAEEDRELALREAVAAIGEGRESL